MKLSLFAMGSRRLVGTALLMGLVGCGAGQDADSPSGRDFDDDVVGQPGAQRETREHDGRLGIRLSAAEASTALAQQWEALNQGEVEPRVFDLGPTRYLDRDMEPVHLEPGTEAEHSTPTDERTVSMILGAGEREYLVEFEPSEEVSQRVSGEIDAELLALAATMQAEPELAADGLRQKNLVGAEGRTRQGIADGITATSWMAAVGLLTLDTNFNTQQCTGTLIRKDVLLTAAHCLVGWDAAAKATYVRKLAFHPRADTTTATTWPWGNWRWRTNGYYYPPEYTGGNCHKPNSYTGTCQESDWAIIRVTKPASAAAHNYYMAVSTQSLASMTDLKNRGYPNCAYNPVPGGCRAKTLFGDKAVCTLGSAVGNDGGNATRVSHACDASVGHSGSALYRYINGVPTIGGVHITDSGVFGNVDANNWMRRITPKMVTTINNVIPTLP
jgi:V8-like Glu-specific endopeptidase